MTSIMSCSHEKTSEEHEEMVCFVTAPQNQAQSCLDLRSELTMLFLEVCSKPKLIKLLGCPELKAAMTSEL